MNYLLLAFALLHGALLLWSFRRGNGNSPRLWLLRFMLLGMCYDNLVQGTGNWFIGADWYQAANYPRYALHATVLPLLTLFGLASMQLAGVQLASKSWSVWFCHLFTAVALGWGLYHEVYLLALEPKTVLGVQKLVAVSGLPPVGTIATNLLLLPMAAAVWRGCGWRWFLLGALFIFLLNGATGAKPWGFLAGNFGELVFIISLLATERYFTERATLIKGQ